MTSITGEKSFSFAVRIVEAYKWLCKEHQEYVLSKQLLRCGTSIGANVSEALGAISKAEFKAKLSIAYKECLETQYWLKLLKETGYIQSRVFDDIYKDAEELGKLLFTSIRTVTEHTSAH